MGLWDWFIEHLTRRPPAVRPQAPQAADRAARGTAAATLDRRGDASRGNAPPIPTESVRWWAPPGVTGTVARPVPRAQLSAHARALEQHLISHFDGHNLNMPHVPRVAENVLKRLRAPGCSMTEIAHDLSEDPVSAASVLRMANSALYRGVEKITSLQMAVTRLGAKAIRMLMMHQSLRAAVFGPNREAHALAEMIWRGSLAAGTIMREIAPLSGIDEEDAFTLGLLHDIGSVITLRLVMDHERTSHESIGTDTFDFLCYETHQEFGELIADAWRLPSDLKSLIADHHVYPRPDDPLRKQRLMLILTDMICQMLGYAPVAQYDLLRADVVRDLRLADHRGLVDLLAALPDRIAAAGEFG